MSQGAAPRASTCSRSPLPAARAPTGRRVFSSDASDPAAARVCSSDPGELAKQERMVAAAEAVALEKVVAAAEFGPPSPGRPTRQVRYRCLLRYGPTQNDSSSLLHTVADLQRVSGFEDCWEHAATGVVRALIEGTITVAPLLTGNLTFVLIPDRDD